MRLATATQAKNLAYLAISAAESESVLLVVGSWMYVVVVPCVKSSSAVVTHFVRLTWFIWPALCFG